MSSARTWARSPKASSTGTTSVSRPGGTATKKNGATSRKSSASFCALPHPNTLKEEDDWTKVKDPRQKKRIQNRVAQRTYRHRMKAKLDELQARLESHEGRASQIPTSLDDTHFSGVSYTPPFTSDDIGLLPEEAYTAANMIKREPHCSIDASTKPHPTTQHYLYEQQQQHQTHENGSSASFQGLMQPDTMFTPSSPTHSSPSSYGLLSPPVQADQLAQDHQGDHSRPNFMRECFNFQTQLMRRLKQLQPDTGFPHPFQDGHLPDNTDRKDSASYPPEFNSIPPCGQLLATYNPYSMWKGERDYTEPRADFMSGTEETTSTTTTTNNFTSPDQRFARIIAQAEAAGFRSFDDMVTAYYTQKFREPSILADEQQLSRCHRLPGVISDIHAAAFAPIGGWSEWERQGFQESIMSVAGCMLAQDGANVP